MHGAVALERAERESHEATLLPSQTLRAQPKEQVKLVEWELNRIEALLGQAENETNLNAEMPRPMKLFARRNLQS